MTGVHEGACAAAGQLALKSRTWPTFWDKAPATAPDIASARSLIRHCRQRNDTMLQAVAQLKTRGHPGQARRLSRRYLDSYSARLHALARAYRRRVGSIQKASDEDVLELIAAADEMSAWRPTGEKAVAYQKPKRGGGFRWVHKHGLFQYALELLTADVASRLADLLPTQFMFNGGLPKLRSWLEDNLPSTALVLTVDIPRCFDTVSRSSLADDLFLPERVVKRVLFDPMDFATYLYPGPMGNIPKPGPIAKGSSAMRGIPQGSALSQVAADVAIAAVMRAISDVHPSVRVASHGDNLIVLMGDTSWKASVIAALTSGVAEHFGTDVSAELPCRISCTSPAAGFAFCRRRYTYKNACMQIRLPTDWIAEYVAKTQMRIERAFSIKQPKEWDSIERSIKGWLRHSPKTDTVINEAAELLAHVKIMRK